MAVKKSKPAAEPTPSPKKKSAPKKAVVAAPAPAPTPEPVAAKTKAPKPKAKPAVATATASKAATPKAAVAPKAAPAAPKKVAAPVKLTDRQLEFLKQIHGSKETGYLLEKKAEAKTIEALINRKLVKKAAKDKTSGHFRYVVSKAGEKHLSTLPPA